ncbi:hypothetical protein [Streptomyces sp. NPDC092370]
MLRTTDRLVVAALGGNRKALPYSRQRRAGTVDTPVDRYAPTVQAYLTP